MIAFRCGPIASIFVLFVLCNSIQLASAEDIIWYQGSSGYFTNHKYAWQATTDGKSAPNVLLASALNQPWLVAIGKSNNMIYFTDTDGVIGAWNVTSRHSSFVYQFDIGSWREDSGGPALTGLDLDELNNHLYFSFNTSIYRLDLSQANPSSGLVASFNNLVFNPRVSSSRGALYFCIRNNFQEQGDLVQMSLLDPTSVTTLVHNTSTGSIVQQLYIDETEGVLYYNSPGTLTMRGVSLTAPYNEVFSSVTLGVNPSFFDFNPTTSMFVFGDLRFSNAYAWSPNGPTQPTNIYSTSEGRVTGVKFFDDTHVLVAYQFSKYPFPNEGKLVLVNINDPSDTSVIAQNFGMGLSLIFDEKYCDFYFVANPNNRTSQTTDHVIFRKNINEDGADVYKRRGRGSEVLSIAFDANKRNLIDNSSGTINYSPIDDPSAPSVSIIDADGRGVITYVVNEKNGDIYYADLRNSFNIYRLEAPSISKDWINNVGHRILSNLGLYNTLLTVDSVNNKLYFLNNSRGVFQSNMDGSDPKLISDLRNVVSMKWDPSTNRLFMISTPFGDWHLMSMNGDGSDVIYTHLKVPYSSGRAPFSNVNPDPFSDWVYLNADFYQPYRIKKDGSTMEPLYSYVPFSALSTIHYDGSSGVLYYGDTYCSIKKINLNSINKDDPAATPFDMVWQGDFIANKLAGFFFDKTHQLFWLLQTEVMTNSKSTYNVSVTPVNGGPTKQLYMFPKDVYPPWTIDTARSKMFAYSYHNRFPSETDQAIVMMDLYNGSNLQRVKEFKYPDYNHIRLTAMTLDSRTGVVYYAIEDSTTSLESFDPITSTTKRLWHAQDGLFVTDIKVNGSCIAMACKQTKILINLTEPWFIFS